LNPDIDRTVDPRTELEVMGVIADALARIPDAITRERVLDWAYSRFGGAGRRTDPFVRQQGRQDKPAASTQTTLQEFGSVADLYTAADPQTENDRALVTAYWIQTHEGNGSFTAQAVNGSLTHMGYGVSNITRTLGVLMDRKPKLVIQLEKSGKTQQARKTYKVTQEGERAVQAMVAGAKAADGASEA
jgi:hypothetical protein